MKYEVLVRNQWRSAFEVLDDRIHYLKVSTIMLLNDFLEVDLVLDIIENRFLEN